MARPLKQGLDYFPLDTDFLSDRKVRKIIYNPQIEMFARFKMKSSFHKTKRII